MFRHGSEESSGWLSLIADLQCDCVGEPQRSCGPTGSAPSVFSSLLFCFPNFSTRPPHLEPVPHPRLRQYMFRVRRVALYLLAKLVDHHAQILGLLAIVRPP